MILWLAQTVAEKAPPPPQSPRSFLDEIAGEFAERSVVPPRVFVWLIGLLIAFLAIRWTINLIRKLRRRTRPVMVYHAIGRELGLDASDRWWLYSLARRTGLVSPLTLLMSPATLDHHAERDIESAPSRRRRMLRRRFESIRGRLFEDAPVTRESAGQG